MNATLILLTLAIGLLTGLRSLTPLAALCWAAHWWWLTLDGTPLALLGSLPVAIVVTLLAFGELVGDKLPHTPNRTSVPMFGARILLSALCGTAIFFAAKNSWPIGAATAVVGAIIGTFAGYHLRHAIVVGINLPDFAVALAEDIVVIAGSFILVSHLV